MTTKKIATLPEMDIQIFEITLIGDSPLICHAWSQKAKDMMAAKDQLLPKEAPGQRDPEQEFRDSLYPLPEGGYGFPAVAFKSAAVDACSHVGSLTKVIARGAFHVVSDMVPIVGTPTPRSDMVRIGMGTSTTRYRGEFRTWSVVLRIRYNANVLSAEQIVHLFNTAGFAIGVGEWRPQREGSFGMFHVATIGEA